jgi:putative membrane protein
MNRHLTRASILLSIPLLTSEALAQTQPYAGHHGPMGDWGWGWGWGGMIFGPLLMLGFLAAAVAVVVLVIRWLGGTQAAPGAAQAPDRSALEILKERYARGEIDSDEYATRKRVLDE